MLSLIEKLQRAPEPTRRLALHVTLAVCMVVVIGVWFQTLDTQLGGKEEAAVGQSPFSVVAEEGTRLWERLEGSVGQVRSQF